MYGGQEMYVQGFGGESEVKNNLEDPGRDGRMILRQIFRKLYGEPWEGLIWFRTGTGGWHL